MRISRPDHEWYDRNPGTIHRAMQCRQCSRRSDRYPLPPGPCIWTEPDPSPAQVKFWAIRHKPTGWFLPIRPGRRGQTASEPSQCETPRLFTSAASARCALKWWLEGIYEIHRWGSGDFGDVDFTEDIRLADKKYQPTRKAEDMEVVHIEVRVTGVDDGKTNSDKVATAKAAIRKYLGKGDTYEKR